MIRSPKLSFTYVLFNLIRLSMSFTLAEPTLARLSFKKSFLR